MAADRQADVVLQRGVPGDGQGEHDHGVRQSGRMVDGACRHPLRAGVQRLSQRAADAARHTRARRRIRPRAADHRGGLPVGVSAVGAGQPADVHLSLLCQRAVHHSGDGAGAALSGAPKQGAQPCADGRARRGRRGAVHRVLSLCVGAGGLPRVAGADELV